MIFGEVQEYNELNLNEGYTDFYLTLQTEDFTPYFENENNLFTSPNFSLFSVKHFIKL